MNFLELSVELAKKADVSGMPSSVDNVRGEHQRIVGWVNQAWTELQLQSNSWSFLWTQASINTGDSVIPKPVDCSTIINDSFYLTTSVARKLTYIHYDEFRKLLRNGSGGVGDPQYWTVRPDDKIQLYPAPQSQVLIEFEYYRKPQRLIASTDVPLLSEQYHMAIVYGGLVHYGIFEEAAGVIAMAKSNYSNYLLQISNKFLPNFSLGGALV